MKTIGLLGGMSWESSLSYYKEINELIKKELGGLHSAKIILNSVDFDEIEKLQHKGDWESLEKILCKAAIDIQNANADFLVICTNTMHKVVPYMKEYLTIPILHIADATAKALVKDGIKKVALLGTSFTMEQDFYKSRLTNNYNLEVIVPNERDRKIIHNIIYEELCLGIIKESSKKEYLRIMKELKKNDAQAIILGCTEIGLLVNQQDTNIKLYDTTKIHVEATVEYCL